MAWNCVVTETKGPKRDVLTTTKGDKKGTDTLSIKRIEPTEETCVAFFRLDRMFLTPTLPPCSPPPPTFSRNTVVDYNDPCSRHTGVNDRIPAV